MEEREEVSEPGSLVVLVMMRVVRRMEPMGLRGMLKFVEVRESMVFEREAGLMCAIGGIVTSGVDSLAREWSERGSSPRM